MRTTQTFQRIVFAASIAAVTYAPGVHAQKKSEDFNWSQVVAAGKTFEIKGVNGGIVAVGTNGKEVKVRAEKRSKKSDVTQVEIKMIETPNGVTLCALYPTPTRRMGIGRQSRPNACVPGPRGEVNVENNDVEVEWTVEVPRGVILAARTVNGDVEATKLTADVTAVTVNGSIEVSTTGLARAETVNGSIDVVMGANTWQRELKFSTVNGGISLTMPGSLNTELNAQTVHGEIDTDWPLTVRGRFGSTSLRGTIGSGGRMLSLETVNGDIEIRKK